ncbi:Oidioi.mRNA.OKI2018_I69.chr2.g6081.t1.cds [Oikopleura dioica]|uniref:Oidioi.mRNA.OKI2018_I69.chr2.g6081.t1.cds n=1 Tax=Oikopleura dioica TaxID=34765 RepID=A0ABN7T5S4_OIKDI|nr:Oidioi.mRNA.OKI2018_I69.chr2.g6081.t1.cds [Oikopleura dioica]
MATGRVKKELKDLAKSPVEGITITPSENDMFSWAAVLEGPKDTPYEGGKFNLTISFPPDYPFKPPKVKVLTKLYHVNVSDEGYICMDILAGSWTPALSIQKVLISFLSFLMSPNPDHALNPDRAKVLRENPDEYYKTARDWVQKHAMEN